MKRKGLIIIIAGIILMISIAIVLFFNSLPTLTNYKKIVTIQNPANKETIYLLQTTWGLNGAKMAIGKDKKLDSGFPQDYPYKYVNQSTGDTPILYKLDNDSLVIYGGEFRSPMQNVFETPVSIRDLDFKMMKHLSLNYKELGFSVFPESQAYVFENHAKLYK